MEQSYLQQLSALKAEVNRVIDDSHILRIEQTSKSPFVFLSGREGIIVICGRSVPDNDADFYHPILEFVSSHFVEASKIQVYVRLIYTGSSSSRYIFLLLRILNTFHNNGKGVNIYWYQDEDDLYSYSDGFDYQYQARFPFHVFELEELEVEEVEKLLSNF